MAAQRIALFGAHTSLAIVACAAALESIGSRPQYRNENVFSTHPSQQENFDAVVVLGDTPEALTVADTHRALNIPVFMIANVDSAEAFHADLGALGFLDFIGAHVASQKVALDETLTKMSEAADSRADAAQLPRIADLVEHISALDADAVRELQGRDVRKTAVPLYAARLLELEPPATEAEPAGTQEGSALDAEIAGAEPPAA